MIEVPINSYMNISSSSQNVRLTALPSKKFTHSSNGRPYRVPPKQAGHRCRRIRAHSMRGRGSKRLGDGDDRSAVG